MVNVIKLRKGLDIQLQGKAEEKKIQLKSKGIYALVPDDFEGVVPKVTVREGDHVKAGDALTGTLTEKQKEQFEDYTTAQREVNVLTNCETFCYAFKLGEKF